MFSLIPIRENMVWVEKDFLTNCHGESHTHNGAQSSGSSQHRNARCEGWVVQEITQSSHIA